MNTWNVQQNFSLSFEIGKNQQIFTPEQTFVLFAFQMEQYNLHSPIKVNDLYAKTAMLVWTVQSKKKEFIFLAA